MANETEQPNTEQTPPAEQSETQSETFPKEYVEQLRRENAGHRTRLKDVESKLKGFEEAQLSESEKAAQRLKDLESQNATLSARVLDATLTEQARAKGFTYPDIAVAAIRAQVTTAEDGTTNAVDLLDALAKEKPALVGSEQAPKVAPALTTGNSPRDVSQQTAVIKTSQIRDREFYKANKDAIHLAIKEGRIVED